MTPNPESETRLKAESGGEESGPDLRAIYALLMRRRWLILSVLLTSIVLGAVITLRAARIYKATAKVLIEDRTPRVLNQVSEVYDPGGGSYWGAPNFYQTQQDIIRSRPVAERVVALLGLNGKSLAEQLRAAGEETLESKVARDPLAGLSAELAHKLKLIGLSGAGTRADIARALDGFDAAAFVQGRVMVGPIKESRIADISVEDTDPERAALFANTIVDAYVDYNLDQRFTTTRNAVDWLSDQLTDLKAKVQQSEMALHDFKQANNIISVSLEDRQSMIAQTLTHMNGTLATTTTKRIELEAKRDTLRRAQADGVALEDVEMLAQHNDAVQTLKTKLREYRQQDVELSLRYTVEHPKLVAVREQLAAAKRELDGEAKHLARAIEDDYMTALDQEKRLAREIDSLKTEALDLNKKEIEYRRLQRESDNNASLLEIVVKRQKEADLTQALNFNNVRKFDAARVPGAPIKPNPRTNLLIALALGLAAALGVAFLVDQLDNSVKSQAQVESLLGLPFLGIVPSIKLEGIKHKDSEPPVRDRFIVENPRSSVAECCRTIRTNLMFMSPDKPAQTLMVTSAGPREGKSTITVNLAMTMAQSGKRTLVIDTDMRKPRLHKSFGIPNVVGISNLILGETAIEAAVQSSGVPNLDVLPCGPIPPNPAELLHTESFTEVMKELARRYDRVIFDTPPVAAVSDALVLASMVDGIVLVIKAQTTTWPSALSAKRRLEGVNGKIFGVVLNDVDLDDKRSSEYYQHYYYYYRQGYGEDEAKKLPS